MGDADAELVADNSSPLVSPSDHSFVINDGNLTVIASVETPDLVRDGSDSGVELSGLERVEQGGSSLDTPLGRGPGRDYDDNSEGGSESSSAFSHHGATPTPASAALPASVRRKVASSVKPSEHSAARARATPVRDRSASSRAGRAGSDSVGRPQRPCSLMTSSLTGSLSASTTGRGTQPSTPRTARTAATKDDGRWPSTVQRAASVSRTRVTSAAGDRKHPIQALTSSSSRNSVNSTNSNTASTPSPTVESKAETFATLPRRRRRRSIENLDKICGTPQAPRRHKITLYHETASQTALTSEDLDGFLEGKSCQIRAVDAVDQVDQEVQANVERDEFSSHMLDRRLRAIVDVLGFEPCGTSQSPSVDNTLDQPAWVKILHLLEHRVVVNVQQRDRQQRNEIVRTKSELERLDRLCNALRKVHQESETETLELQEFLQQEKVALSDGLKEAEMEVKEQKARNERLQEELERQREECQHLVRISEKRRQEILTLEARVAGLEVRSREALLQQGAAVSGASVALCALSSRLDGVAAKLEGAVSDDALSVIAAEAEAVLTHTKEVCRPISIHMESVYQTLDNVTEPVLEDDSGQRDSVNLDTSDTARMIHSESIQNLSAAILNRCLQEEAINSYSSTSEDASVHLVDQVLGLDTSITRVLRAIQQSMGREIRSSETNNEEGRSLEETEVGSDVRNVREAERSSNCDLLDTSVKEALPCKEGNMTVSSGIIEIGFTSGRVTSAS